MTDAIGSSAAPYRCFAWYAGAERAASKWKFVVYDDKGPLLVDHDNLQFNGLNSDITINWLDVIRVERRGQQVPSHLHAVFVAVAAIFGAIEGAQNNDYPILYALVGLSIFPLIYWLIIDRVAALFAKMWTIIHFQTAQGASQAWFVDGERLGWSKMGRKATELHNAISGHCKASSE